MTTATTPPKTSALLSAGFGVPPTGTPPRRLSEGTRLLAARYLSGAVGATMRPAPCCLDESAALLPLPTRYAIAIEQIAHEAPLCLDPDELLVGAAHLHEATWHLTPGSKIPAGERTKRGEIPRLGNEETNYGIRSTSHITIDLPKLLRVGFRGLRDQVQERLQRGGLDDRQTDNLTAMLRCIDAAGVWHGRYIKALEELSTTSARATALLDSARRVPNEPPTTFREAIQSLWFGWTFLRLCGNWCGLGRVDAMLSPYLRRDLDKGTITLDEARELLAHFWIKGCEWIGAPEGFGSGSSGDAQFYQNVVLGGIDATGEEIPTEVTQLILEVVEELHIGDLPIAVRVSERTRPEIWTQIARVQRLGGGIVSIYNEDLVIRSLVRFGYPLEEAREFTNDGCWEVLIPGKTAFCYKPFDTLQLLQDALGNGDYASFEDLYAAYRDRLTQRMNAFADEAATVFNDPSSTSPLLSLFVDDCIETGGDYHRRGPRYTVCAPHAGGLPDVANSLHVIQKAVFDERRISLPELVAAMRDDWVGHESLRHELSRDYVLYGNADPEADAMMRRVFDDYVAVAAEHRECGAVLCPPGISTFGREIEWRGSRQATAFGRPAHSILAGNLAPTPGSELHGMTAVVRSFCSLDFEGLTNGVPLDLNIAPTTLSGDNGLLALTALLQTFVRLGGWYLQINVVDRTTLLDAQRNPERYPNLTVRISGWSARFATLDAQWQEMVIQRAVGLG